MNLLNLPIYSHSLSKIINIISWCLNSSLNCTSWLMFRYYLSLALYHIIIVNYVVKFPTFNIESAIHIHCLFDLYAPKVIFTHEISLGIKKTLCSAVTEGCLFVVNNFSFAWFRCEHMLRRIKWASKLQECLNDYCFISKLC